MGNTKLEICKKCWGTGHVHGGDENSSWSKTCEDCHGIGFIRVAKTNADRFHSATNDALKEEIHAISLGFKPWCDYHCANEGDDGCDNCIGEWLQQPAEEVKDA